MTLYVTKNGERLGPYTIAEVQALIANGTYHAADWAWYEGLTDWIPLQQVPGVISSTPVSAPVVGGAAVLPGAQAPVRRPVLVWIICLLYFITIPLGLVALAATPYLLSFSAKTQQQVTDQIQSQLDRTTDPAQREQLATALSQLKSSQTQVAKLANHGFLYYGLAVLSMIVNLAAAILLFMLRRAAWPAFIVAFVVGALGAIYNFTTIGFPQEGGAAQTIGMIAGIVGAVIGWGISIAILVYVWSLARRGVLR